MKVLLLGDSGVGKSAFLARHLTGEFLVDHVENTREVVQLNFSMNDRAMHFEVHENATAELGVEGIIFMCDLTQPSSILPFETIRANYPTVPMVVVANKCDQKISWSSRSLFEEFQALLRSKNVPVYEVSAKSFYNFEKPFAVLAQPL